MVVNPAGGNTGKQPDLIPGMGSGVTPDPHQVISSTMLTQLSDTAEMYASKGDFENAIKCYEQITIMDPQNGPVWTSLGHCYLLVDNLPKAFTSYHKALYSLPDVRDPQLWYGIGLLYEKVLFFIRLV